MVSTGEKDIGLVERGDEQCWWNSGVGRETVMGLECERMDKRGVEEQP
jgi:hypothetical protein